MNDKVYSVTKEEFVLSQDSKKYFSGNATKGSVGYDIKVRDYVIDWKRNSVVYFTGIRAIITGGKYYLEVVPRSSVYKKKHICAMSNSIGVIDKDYTGEVRVTFRLQFRSWFERMWYRLGLGKLDIYEVGDRVAQLIIRQHFYAKEIKLDSLDNMKSYVKAVYGGDRLDKGFGSTGK